jgi:cytoskeletal protein CcmA (bactofilin family)
VAAGLVLEGPVSGVGPLVIAGAVHGDIRVKGNVLLLPRAWVEGSISAHNVEVHGRVEGRVNASTLLLKCGGHVVGEVSCGQLLVDAGGRLDGGCAMEPADPLSRAAVPQPPPFGVLSA